MNADDEKRLNEIKARLTGWKTFGTPIQALGVPEDMDWLERRLPR